MNWTGEIGITICLEKESASFRTPHGRNAIWLEERAGQNQAQIKKEKNWSEIKRLQRWQVENVNSCGYHSHNTIRLKLHLSSILCSEEKADWFISVSLS